MSAPHDDMSAPHEPPTDAFAATPRAAGHDRGGIAKWVRTLAVPIIIGWVAVVALLNVIVPQLEVVGQMKAVSMTPDAAPSMISMKRPKA